MIDVFDLHNDFLTELKTYDKQKRYISAARKTGLMNVCSAVWTTSMNREMALASIERAEYFARNNNVKFAVEDLWFAKNIDDIQWVADMNPAYIGLTWNNENKLGGGSKSFSGLTQFGFDAVKLLEDNHIQIDTAHLNEQSFMNFSNITTRPILCSHTACGNLTHHTRNLRDYQLKIISESGGLVGIAFVPEFLTEEQRASNSDVTRHIDYLVCKLGIDHVGIGTDFYWTRIYPKHIRGYKSLLRVQNELQLLGYTTSSIEKIFFRNVVAFFDKNF